MKHVQKYNKDFFPFIIMLGTDISERRTMFYDRVKSTELVNRAHVLKYLHGRKQFGPSEKRFHKGTLWREPRAIISFIPTKQIFVHLYHHGD